MGFWAKLFHKQTGSDGMDGNQPVTVDDPVAEPEVTPDPAPTSTEPAVAPKTDTPLPMPEAPEVDAPEDPAES